MNSYCLPWKFNDELIWDSEGDVVSTDADHDDETKKVIVHRVNNFEPLLEALKSASIKLHGVDLKLANEAIKRAEESL